MTIQLNDEQRKILEETKRIDTPQEFQALLAAAKPELIDIFEVNQNEIQGPNQPIDTTLIELRDLYLTTGRYVPELAARFFDEVRRSLFRDVIRLLDTANAWFNEADRTGNYRPRPVLEVIDASRDWRAEIKAIGAQAFVRNPSIAEKFADINSTRTLDEERQDLRDFNALISAHEPRLRIYGLTDKLIEKGKSLLQEADGRDLLGVIGLRSEGEASTLRNQVLTYAIFLAKEARAAGINAFFRDPQTRALFEASTFRNAIRRLQERRKSDAPAEPKPATKTPTSEEDPQNG